MAQDEPLRALALLGGVLSFAALASAFGRCSRSSRLFLALFLLWFYISLNAPKIAPLDAVGFLGAANPGSIAMWLGAGALALFGAALWNRRES
ncbi:hypothetical protein LP419_27350 [Massilia sp. H-1]|nr:hypothetical protein LP419_27350 [Massilia sp. H-1]